MSDSKTNSSDPTDPQPPDLAPIDGNGDGNGGGGGNPLPPRITNISPIGGLLAGGFDVVLTGTRFQFGAEVFFGAVASPQVLVNGPNQVIAQVPPATQVGTVNVSLVNPDGETAFAPGGFTYVSSEGSLHAEVLGVSSLSVIEDTETEITLRGRNLISAYNDGIVALRGPSRVQITFSNFGSSSDPTTGIDSLTLTVRVRATPPLLQHERIAIQVLASLRADAAGNGIFTSSRQMFTVLPRAVPVALAFTANLDPSRPNLVMVAGRNLEGASLELGGGVIIHSQKSDEHTIAALVSFPEVNSPPPSLSLELLDPVGQTAAQFNLTVEQSFAMSASSAEGTVSAQADPGEGGLGLTLTPVPDQQLTGPTKEDNAVFSLRGDSLFPTWGFDGIFFYEEFDIDILIPLFNEVRLIPFFDNGVGDFIDNTPVLAQVGKLFRLRGVGLLVALRVDLFIRIHVVIIIGIIFLPWDFGFFNEFFNDFPFGIGSIVVSIRVTVQVFISLAFMVALVEPGGHLRMLFFFNLELGVDFFFSADNRVLRFNTNLHFKVDYTRVSPFHSLLPCDGRFQLAEENGQTVFTDNFGGTVAYYFPRSVGQCCLLWDFNLRLIQFEEGGPDEILQDSFRTEFCLNAAPPTNVVNIIVTSEHPAPTGTPRHLFMTFSDRAALKALAEPADENGFPTGPPQDVRDLGYDPEFLLEPLFPDLFNPSLFPSGDAIPVQAGDNTIHVKLHPRDQNVALFSFRPADVFGFVIQSFISQGLLPAVVAGALPVTVQDPTKIIVKSFLAFRDPTATDPAKLNEAPLLFTIPIAGSNPPQQESVQRLNRCEPFETQPLQYFLCAKITSKPTSVNFPITLKLKVPSATEMKIFANGQQQTGAPLAGTDYPDGRPSVSAIDQFFSAVPPANQEIQITFSSLTDLKALFPITPHLKEVAASGTTPRKLVPPGELVASRTVMLLIKLNAEDASSTQTPVEQSPQLFVGIHHDETYEEYRRLFTEAQDLFTGTDTTIVSYKNFPGTFLNELLQGSAAPTDAALKTKGDALWTMAVNAVQSATTQTLMVRMDDRLLYWTRLLCIGALRGYYARKQTQALDDPKLAKFERPTRGLTQAGVIDLGAGTRKAIVTGFDPFQLDSVVKKTNPSGLVALWFSGKTVASTVIRTAIFPVRYKEFDEGLVESAVGSNLASIALLMTTSQGVDRYDVERYAGKNRRHDIRDNNHNFSTGSVVPNNVTIPALTVPPGIPALSDPDGREFIESSLPYERVITQNEDTRKLPGPHTLATSYTDDTDFVLNQGYSTVGGSSFPATPGRGDETSFKKQATQPVPFVDAAHPGETSRFGSGDAFLSNEIFYRTARLRLKNRPALPSGHLHIPILGPPLGIDPTLAPGLLNAVDKALTRFLNDTLKLRSLGDIAFPDTPITRPSAPLPLKAQNETAADVQVASVEVDLPQIFVLQTTLPVLAPANGQLQLSFVFRPNNTSAAGFATIVRAKDAAGVILFSAQLRGKGIAAPPAPVVTGFSPTIGIIGDSVLIVGTDFDGATEVKVGTVALAITAVTSTQIEADITGPARTGPISVTTPSGTGTSSQSFSIRNPPRRPPDF